MKEIAIFTDVHGMLEPLESVLEDIKRRNIKDVYSLGDNIGVGPNSNEVLDLLNKYQIKSVAGNSEYYTTIGIDPFRNYFTPLKEESQIWTYNKLSSKNIKMISLYPPSIELFMGGKEISLCHFANDVRIDFFKYTRSTWTYQYALNNNQVGYHQFDYTNSEEQKREIMELKDYPGSFFDGYRKAYQKPIFNGKMVNEFDAILQGHVHFKYYEESLTTRFYTLRALGIGCRDNVKNLAAYYILKEKPNGFSISEVLVPFNRDRLLGKIEKSDMPDKSLVKKYLNC